MALCPVANARGCDNCAIVKVCVLRSVLGDYGEKKPEQQSEDAKATETESESSG